MCTRRYEQLCGTRWRWLLPLGGACCGSTHDARDDRLDARAADERVERVEAELRTRQVTLGAAADARQLVLDAGLEVIDDRAVRAVGRAGGERWFVIVTLQPRRLRSDENRYKR